MALYYSTSTDLLRVAPPYLRTALLDDAGTGAEAAGVADLLLEEAESTVDSYLSAQWLVPLTDAQLATARRLTLEVWLYLAHRRQGSLSEVQERAYERTLAELRDVRDGRNERRPEHAHRVDHVLTGVGGGGRIFVRGGTNDTMGGW